LSRSLAGAYGRLARAQGGVGLFNLGDMPGAGDSHASAVALFEQALRLNPADEDSQSALGDAKGDMALWLKQQGRAEEALALARQGLAQAHRSVDAHPGDAHPAAAHPAEPG